MIILLLFIFSVIGMTEIITQSDLFQYLKDWLINIAERKNWKINWLINALNCSQCVGFWSGIVMGLIFLSNTFWLTFACGCAGSMLCNLYVLLYSFVQNKMSITLDTSNESV